MNEKTVLDFLSIQNKWWVNIGKFPIQKIKSFKRSDYYYIEGAEITKAEATLITGPRGVGKSTVMFELMRSVMGLPENLNSEDDLRKIKLADSATDRKRVLYISFDENRLQKLKLIEVLATYSKFVLREDISKLTKKIYVFFDEIQNIDDWGTQIKMIQDLEYPIKLFISGSSSVAMKNEAAKATRRISLYSMHALKFSDFLRYRIKNDDFHVVLDEIKEFRSEFIDLVQENNSQKIFEKFMQFYVLLKDWQTDIELEFRDYLVRGGYPGLLDEKKYINCSTKLRDTFWLGFHKDLVLAKGIGDPAGMKDLVEYIASISSSETTFTSLRTKSGATSNNDQLKKYLYHLENAYLISTAHKYKSTSLTRKTSNFKIYLCDIAIRNMLQGMLNKLLLDNDGELGLVTETLVFEHMLRFYFKIRPHMPIQYSREKKEVDIVMKLDGHSIPIEVKKADEPSMADISGLKTFCRGGKPGFVSCGKKLAINDNIIFLPHWLLIMIV